MKKILLTLVIIFSLNFSLFAEGDFTVHLGGAVTATYNYFDHLNFYGDCDITVEKLPGINLEIFPNFFVKPYAGFAFAPFNFYFHKVKQIEVDSTKEKKNRI